ATDFALAKAIGWNAKVILSVPCCQHEINGQIQNEVLAPILKYGLIKERIAALVTDAMRAEYLESEGYDAQILEFIDMEHTPKNILIRAVKTKRGKSNKDSIEACENFLHITPKLGELLKQKGE
ncbi:MAG: SAM-dependent methyltransferase, partial [Lachnospiraceae bacterium]|nr:SAM-dependent methyltransferase [Lachnospiraceae bacterium]